MSRNVLEERLNRLSKLRKRTYFTVPRPSLIAMAAGPLETMPARADIWLTSVFICRSPTKIIREVTALAASAV